MWKEGLKMDSKKKTKRIYYVEIAVVDDIEKFKEETGNKDDGTDFIPEHVMIPTIKKAIKRFGNISLPGVDVVDAEIEFSIFDAKEDDKRMDICGVVK